MQEAAAIEVQKISPEQEAALLKEQREHDVLEAASGPMDYCLRKRLLRNAPTAAIDAFERILLDRKYRLNLEVDGNYTIATLTLGGTTNVGIAKRNPIDPPSQRGSMLAVQRAVDKLLKGYDWEVL